MADIKTLEDEIKRLRDDKKSLWEKVNDMSDDLSTVMAVLQRFDKFEDKIDKLTLAFGDLKTGVGENKIRLYFIVIMGAFLITTLTNYFFK